MGIQSLSEQYTYLKVKIRSKLMAQIPKGRLVKGPYKPICRDG